VVFKYNIYWLFKVVFKYNVYLLFKVVFKYNIYWLFKVVFKYNIYWLFKVVFKYNIYCLFKVVFKYNIYWLFKVVFKSFFLKLNFNAVLKVYFFLLFCGISAQATTISTLIYHGVAEIMLCEILFFSNEEKILSTKNSILVFKNGS
jgi:hypothetical protein